MPSYYETLWLIVTTVAFKWILTGLLLTNWRHSNSRPVGSQLKMNTTEVFKWKFLGSLFSLFFCLYNFPPAIWIVNECQWIRKWHWDLFQRNGWINGLYIEYIDHWMNEDSAAEWKCFWVRNFLTRQYINSLKKKKDWFYWHTCISRRTDKEGVWW